MSVQRHITLICDADDGQCGSESPSEMTETKARQTARRMGWKIGRNRDDIDLCPEHRDDPDA